MGMAIGTSSSDWHRLSTMYHGSVYYYLTDIAYHFGGLTTFAARFLPALYSSISIVLVYLLVKELEGRKLALLSSAFFAFLSMQAVYGTVSIMEPFLMPLLLLSLLLFVRHLKAGKRNDLLLAVAFFAVAVTTKLSALYFLPAFGVLFASSRHKGVLFVGAKSKKRNELPAEFIGLAAFLLLPIVAYNYLLYESRGLTDFMVLRILNLESSAKWYATQGMLPPVPQIYNADLVHALLANISIPAALLALIGIYAAFRKGKSFYVAFLAFPLLTFNFYVFHDYYLVLLAPQLAILSAFGAEKLGSLLPELNRRTVVLAVAVLFIASELLLFAGLTAGASSTYKLREYALSLQKEKPILLDPLISPVRAFWAFNEFPLMTSLGLFKEKQKWVDAGAVDTVTENFIYVECVADYCGYNRTEYWGYSNFSDYFNGIVHERSDKMLEIMGPQGPEYAVWNVAIDLPGQMLPFSTKKTFLGYVFGHPELSADVYSVRTPVQKLIDAVAQMSILLNIALVISVPLFAAKGVLGSR